MSLYLITGVSSGFGRAIADAALAAGNTVVGTLRDEADRLAFERHATGRARGVLLDVTDEGAIPPTIDRIEQTIGPIAVLVNNAGFGHQGLIEESTSAELRRQFEVNVFGAVAMMRAVLPAMRTRRRGHIGCARSAPAMS